MNMLQGIEIPGIKIFRFHGPVFSANFEYFKEKLFQKCGFHSSILAYTIQVQRRFQSKKKLSVKNQIEIIEDDQIQKGLDLELRSENICIYQENQSTSSTNDNSEAYCQSNRLIPKILGKRKSDTTSDIQHIILDCSGWSYIDITATKLLISVIFTYTCIG